MFTLIAPNQKYATHNLEHPMIENRFTLKKKLSWHKYLHYVSCNDFLNISKGRRAAPCYPTDYCVALR